MGLPYLTASALSAILAVLIVMAASITLLPALLGFAGARIDRLQIPGTNRARPPTDATPAARWSRAVQRRPWLAAIAGAAVLLVLASPFTGLRLGFPDARQRRARHHDAPGLRPRHRRASAPAPTGRCCSSRRPDGAGDGS